MFIGLFVIEVIVSVKVVFKSSEVIAVFQPFYLRL